MHSLISRLSRNEYTTTDWITTANTALPPATTALPGTGSLFSRLQRDAFPRKYLSAKQTLRNPIREAGGGVAWNQPARTYE